MREEAMRSPAECMTLTSFSPSLGCCLMLVGVINPQATAVDFGSVQVVHRAFGNLHVIVLAEAVPFRLARVSVAHQPATTGLFTSRTHVQRSSIRTHLSDLTGPTSWNMSTSICSVTS
jgi:hypothetical protein